MARIDRSPAGVNAVDQGRFVDPLETTVAQHGLSVDDQMSEPLPGSAKTQLLQRADSGVSAIEPVS